MGKQDKIDRFWLRGAERMGRPVAFEDPQEMWKTAIDYFEYTYNRTFNRPEFVGKEGKEVEKKIRVPFSKQSFCLFAGTDSGTFDSYKHMINREGLAGEELDKAKLFNQICLRIEEIIFAQNYEGAVTYAYNGNPVARYLGLTDKKDITSDGQQIQQLGGVRVELPDGVNLNNVLDVEAEDVTNVKPLKIRRS